MNLPQQPIPYPTPGPPPNPVAPGAQALLDHALTRGLLTLLGGQAVVLDGAGQLLAWSEDALTALGLNNPFPPDTPFPPPEALDLPAKGLQAHSLPFTWRGQPGQMWVFKDVRASTGRGTVAAALFEELSADLGGLEAELAGLEDQPMLQRSILPYLRSLASRLRDKLKVNRQMFCPDPPAPAEPLGATAAVQTYQPAAEHRLTRDTILVMDDSPIVLRLIETILTRADHRVLTSETGEEGLALAATCLPDLILLDALMPGMNGFQVCARLKADPRTQDIPVLFVTALRGEADEVAALNAGAIDFIPKPILPATLLARVRNHLELKHSKDRLRALSLLDGLTGIANRRQFDLTLDLEWQRAMRNNQPISLIMGDVDRFKSYNDHLGHAEGDACLRNVARAFRDALKRPGDLSARFGGEEFACVLPDTDAAGARLVAEDIMALLRARAMPYPGSRPRKYVTVSLGLATMLGTPGQSPLALVQEADRNLYEAKHTGRDRMVQSG